MRRPALTALHLRWLALALAALGGTVGFSVGSDAGLRAGLSFLGGLALVVAAFEFGSFNIRFAGRYLPNLTLVVAMLSYATTAIALGLVLAASSPRVVHGWGIASGLMVGLLIWIGTEIAQARVRSEHT
ncbi:MAG: hypothetical protein QOK10_880 [Pseudonocardiales bacterium]|nr:hypothetical protein [Pseudonocardiales bacterium]